MTHRGIQAQVTLTDSKVAICLEDIRSESLEIFENLSAGQRATLSEDAWSIGLRALMTAYRQAEEARLTDIGRTLVEDIDKYLRTHAESQEKALTAEMRRYFDPNDGELGARMKQFLGNEGILVHLLEKHLAADNSVLASTLSSHVGKQSPLFKLLSPTDSEGLVHLMSERLEGVLQEEHGEFLKALDPHREDGALGKMLKNLRDEMKQARDDESAQLKIALQALDTGKEDSLLNQMRRETQKAREDLLKAINPAAENSPLAIIKTSLTTLLSEHMKTMEERLEAERKENTEHRRLMQESIQRIEARRREEARSSRGGAPFEEAVAAFAQRMIGASGYVVDSVGDTTGLRPNCKVGDVVIGFPREHAFAEARVVLEAKRDKSYTVSKALAELEVARKNRDAQVGIFVLATSHAQPGFQTFARYGRDVLVLWNDQDPGTDSHFEAALMLGLALAQRTKCMADEGDVNALREVAERLEAEVKRLATIQSHAESIKKKAEAIEKEARVGDKKLCKILDDTKLTLTALNVELNDEAVERADPIVLNSAWRGEGANDFESSAKEAFPAE